jgi:hypothetical protein
MTAPKPGGYAQRSIFFHAPADQAANAFADAPADRAADAWADALS